MGGGGGNIKKYSETKNDYIFMLFYQILKNFSIYKFLKILGTILAPPSGRRPGAAAPPPCPPPRYATAHLHSHPATHLPTFSTIHIMTPLIQK